MKIDIKKCLEFFDEGPNYGDKHASAIVGMIGEDLNLIAFKHYMQSIKSDIEILSTNSVPNTGRVGPRLDSWIFKKHGNILYQCEIKNWSSWAFGGRRLMINADKLDAQENANYYWNKILNDHFIGKRRSDRVSKVLIEMNPPIGYEKNKRRPLLLFWWPVSKDKKLTPFFTVKTSALGVRFNYFRDFKELDIFSVSLYFRELLNGGVKHIEFNVPRVENRKKILDSILKK